jgi:predicted dehydrogenase
MTLLASCICAAFLLVMTTASVRGEEDLRIGIIGCDTSHAHAFTEVFNRPDAGGDFAHMRVVAAFPSGSDDIPESKNRLPQFVEKLKAQHVKIVDSIDALLAEVDVVLLESVDGRKHLELAKPVIAAGKPLFVDKPMAGSLADAMEIFRLAKEKQVPCFSSSALRFTPAIADLRSDPKVGNVLGCDAYSPCSLESHHPDLFWYGVHGVETLFTLMGPGCKSVTRTHTDGTDVVVGVWKDGRVGTFRGIRAGAHDFGAVVFGSKGVVLSGKFGGYGPLVEQIARFFRTHQAPVSSDETLEILAFMEAADESNKRNGQPVSIEETLEQAKTRGK